MIRKFFYLEWKSFLRSASFKTNLALKIVLGIVLTFYGILILAFGVLAYFGLEEEGKQPLVVVNQFLIFWLLGDLVLRYLSQKTPVMWIRALLPLPISKKSIVHYLLGKSAFSFFNLYPFLFIIPFSVTLLFNGFSFLGVTGWAVALTAFTFLNNYLNIAINNKNWLFFTLLFLLAGLGLLNYYELLDIKKYAQPVFQSFYDYPFLALVPVAVAVLMYRFNFRHFYKSLYLDDSLQGQRVSGSTKEYTWLNRFGLMGTFLKNDLRLLLRNKRAKSALWTSLFFLFYGFFFLYNPAFENMSSMSVFSGLFISGGFLFTFGGFVPSWDSSYYPLMMSQNIRYREYLKSKWWLIVVGVFAAMILSSFYLFINKDFYWGILAGGSYNIGVNSYITMMSGAYTKTPLNLESRKNLLGDKKAFNFKTLLLSIPQMVLPLVIFFIFKFIYNSGVGFMAVAATGLIGLIFRNPAFNLIEKVYKEEKYSTVAAYKQQA